MKEVKAMFSASAIAKTKLPWSAFDSGIQKQVENNFKDAMEWIAGVLFLPDRVLDEFMPCNEKRVGAVILSQDMKVLSFVWNGFP